MKEKEAKYLEKFFSYIKIQAAKEEKDEKLSEVQVDMISDTKEQDDEISNENRLDEVDERSPLLRSPRLCFLWLRPP